VEAAIRWLEFARSSVFDGLHQRARGIPDIILKICVTIEIVVAGGVG
jgi:hypothetical protein